MLTLRLARAGSKKRPVYHLVAADRRARRDGRFVENLGYYIPNRKVLVLKHDRIDYWLGVGAQVTDTARGLINKSKRAATGEAAASANAPVATPVVSKPAETKAAAKPEPKKAEAKVETEVKTIVSQKID